MTTAAEGGPASLAAHGHVADPEVPPERSVKRIDGGLGAFQVTARHVFMQTPDAPLVTEARRRHGIHRDVNSASHHLRGSVVRLWLGVLSAAALAALPACSTRIGDGAAVTAEGRPCARDMDCPQPSNPCQVWTCWQKVCTPVAAARNTLLPREAQSSGDCRLLVCDGEGQTTSLADDADLPPEDDNPCADEVCQDGAPAYPPVEVGAPCGKGGVCNGHGKCGACLPQAQRCQGNRPEVCSEEGTWESEGPCAAETPVCSGKACIGIHEVAAGAGFSCGRLSDGKVRCFGDPDSGRLGQEGARRVAGLSGVRQISAGAEHTCALMGDQTVRCWGSNLFEQLADGTPEARGVPAPVPKLEKVTQISAGELFTCARLEDGTAVCWGSNEYGQLGAAPVPGKPAAGLMGMARMTSAQDRPTEVVGIAGAVELALGRSHACARLADGGVSCWGSDASGALGRGSPPAVTDKKKLKPARALLPVRGLKGVAEVAAGGQHACARLDDGTVTCWGRNHHGQLGDGTTKARTSPVTVKGLAGAVGLALGDAHSCARLGDGTVTCWGSGALNQLGDAAKADHPEPFAVPEVKGVAALSSGAVHLCARLGDRTFVCWGSNSHGELGSGATGEKPSPVLW